jgi:hypothetical protein
VCGISHIGNVFQAEFSLAQSFSKCFALSVFFRDLELAYERMSSELRLAMLTQ